MHHLRDGLRGSRHIYQPLFGDRLPAYLPRDMRYWILQLRRLSELRANWDEDLSRLPRQPRALAALLRFIQRRRGKSESLGRLSEWKVKGEVEMARKSLKKSTSTRSMSAMRMPGFSAEASLYTSPATYRSGGGAGETFGAVQPAYEEGWCSSPYCKISIYRGNLVCICHFPQ
jgi:hypothetical protein